MKKSPLPYAVLGLMLIFIAAFGNPAFGGVDKGEVSATWSVWSCWYWPWVDHLNPNLYDAKEAMFRYDKFDKGAQAQKWEYQYHGPPQNPDDWWGHCHAWSAAACWEGQPNSARTLNKITFRVRDRKGLMVETYYDCADGTHNELYVSKPSPGLFWAWLRKEIKGIDPMHGHAMGFIGELYYGDEVWNYPIYKYVVTYSGNPSSGTSGTMTVFVAKDGAPKYAGSTKLFFQKFIYQFSGVQLNSSGDPTTHGTWIGSGPYHRPDCIWRPYYATTWMTYVANDQLDESHLANILNP